MQITIDTDGLLAAWVVGNPGADDERIAVSILREDAQAEKVTYEMEMYEPDGKITRGQTANTYVAATHARAFNETIPEILALMMVGNVGGNSGE